MCCMKYGWQKIKTIACLEQITTWKMWISIVYFKRIPVLDVLSISSVTALRRIPPLDRYVKLRIAHAPGMSGTFSPPPRVSDPGMHHGTCVTHVPWCMPGSQTSGFLWRRWRGNVPGIPGACATRNFTYLARGPWDGEWLVQVTVIR